MENQFTNSRFQRLIGKPVIIYLTASFLGLPLGAHAQTRFDSPDKVANAIAQVESGDFGLAIVEQLAEAHAVQAVPALKQQFELSRSSARKAQIASALVRLGEKDETYWNYLTEQATEAVQSDLPPDHVRLSRKSDKRSGIGRVHKLD